MKSITLFVAMLFVSAPARAANYYVNDASTSGDVYCTAAGSSGNDGQSSSTPKDTINGVVTNFDLGPGDTIYVDTGTYNLTERIVLPSADSGSAADYMTIQGSTNTVTGGTVLNRGGDNIFCFFAHDHIGAEYYRLRNMTLINATAAITADHVAGSDNLFRYNRFEELIFSNNTAALDLNIGDYDVSAGDVFSKCIFTGNTAYQIKWGSSGVGLPAVTLDQCVIYQTAGTAIFGQSIVSNSIFYSSGSGVKMFYPDDGQRGDYNLFFMTGGATLGTLYTKISSRTATLGADKHSLAAEDPLFVNAAAGDFHLQSTEGHWTTGGWVTDAATSPAIDIGDPAASAASEPSPNGSRINMGAHGGTVQASKSPSDKWLQVLTFNDGGVGAATNDLYWAQRNLSGGGDTVKVECSTNSGASWVTLTTGVPASTGTYRWNATAMGNLPVVLWRVVYEADNGISSTTRNTFSVKSFMGDYYVNDSTTAGDIYCTAAGSSGNSGLFPNVPASSLSAIIVNYDLKGGDVVYVDTGVYSLNADITILPGDSGDSVNNMVTIQGSTNVAAGGTVFDRNGSGSILSFYANNTDNGYIQYMHFKDLVLQNAQSAVILGHANFYDWRFSYNVFERITFKQNSYGVNCQNDWDPGFGTIFDSCIFAGNSTRSLFWNMTSAPETRRATLNHCAFYQASGAATIQGPCTISNSIVYATGAGNTIFTTTDVRGDYNDIYASGGAIIHSSVNNDFSAWTNATRDAHSITADPLYVDPAAGDLHLKGRGGHWTPSGNVRDLVSSPCLDAGDPVLAYDNEPRPNGRRIDIGPYGNTIYASRASGFAGTVILVK